MAALAEALAFGEASGLDREKVVEILEAGAGSSMVLTAKKVKLLEEDFCSVYEVFRRWGQKVGSGAGKNQGQP